MAAKTPGLVSAPRGARGKPAPRTAMHDASGLCIGPDDSIREAIARIDRSEAKIALVTGADRRLADTVTDGDIRRALLAGIDLNAPISRLKELKASSPYSKPVTGRVGARPSALLRLMDRHGVRHLPLLDERQRVAGLVTRRDVLPTDGSAVQAVVMAGGFGNRLRPLTDDLPKAMLPVGDRPLLELILQELRGAGIQHVSLTTHYKRELIEGHFGTGRKFGLELQYIYEDSPRGTAGSLSALKTTDAPILVMNGDIVTKVDFRAMLDFHREHRADMTIAVRNYEVSVPYGVVESDGVSVVRLSEKPVLRHFINAGIYLLNPQICRLIPRDTTYDMTDLIERLIDERYRVVSFPIREYWIDIGQMENYKQALHDAAGQARGEA